MVTIKNSQNSGLRAVEAVK